MARLLPILLPRGEVYVSRWAPQSSKLSEGAFVRSLVGSTPIHLRYLLGQASISS